MITTLTLNPCVDRTIEFDGFQYGATNKVTAVRSDISGKGINVSIALQQLGRETTCLGFDYKDDELLKESLTKKNISFDLVNVPGRLRTNIKAFDTKTSVMTEFNESGEPVRPEHVDQMMKKVEEYIRRSDIMVINGSAPPGVPVDFYRQIIEKVNAGGKRAVLDAHGELLVKGIKAAPFLIKPNRQELEEAFDCKIQSQKDAVTAARKIIAQGVTWVCISMGKDGAMLISRDKVYFSEGADIPVRGVQGAGDSLVAGMCMAIQDGAQPAEILRYGVAVAHGSLIHKGTQMCMPEDLKAMLGFISVHEIKE